MHGLSTKKRRNVDVTYKFPTSLK